ncbi:hypothetical protein ABE504_26745 [Paenibacillus oryzisoli]|uniref:hypothetical protein n=1 Tax=Paenibacillus oryzisoli TaxID=1850517 RepID=UPI003D2D2C55
MYFIELEGHKESIELSVSVSHESFSSFPDFPEIDFNYGCYPIHHTIKLLASTEILREELGYLNLKSELEGKYHYDKSTDELIIAKISISEFPSEWKETMGDSWFMWLDALDGDHAVVGERADEIEENDLYDDPFLFGNLFYIDRVDVHPLFRANKTGINLIIYTFRYLINDTDGMVFLIAKPMQSLLSEDKEDFKSSARLANYYKKCGFKRVSGSNPKSILMESKVSNLRKRSVSR